MEVNNSVRKNTPTKPVKRGPKPKEEGLNDLCRLCGTHLKLKFEGFQKVSYISTENLFQPSARAGINSKETFVLVCFVQAK